LGDAIFFLIDAIFSPPVARSTRAAPYLRSGASPQNENEGKKQTTLAFNF
jgi:hypothetical protein